MLFRETELGGRCRKGFVADDRIYSGSPGYPRGSGEELELCVDIAQLEILVRHQFNAAMTG